MIWSCLRSVQSYERSARLLPGSRRRDCSDAQRRWTMRTPSQPEGGRLEQILQSIDHFKPMATRRSFMQKLMLAGGTAAVASAGLGRGGNVFASSPVLDFVNAAVGAERIGIAFYGNALGSGSPYSIPRGPATHTPLNSSHPCHLLAAVTHEAL